MPSTKSASGSLIGGNRSFSPESSSAARASARSDCEIAIENRIETAEPNVSQRAAREHRRIGRNHLSRSSMPNAATNPLMNYS